MRHASLTRRLTDVTHVIDELTPTKIVGRVVGASGLAVDIDGLSAHVGIGDRIVLRTTRQEDVISEVVGFRGSICKAMAYASAEGLGLGSEALATLPACPASLAVDETWIGRVVDPLGNPLDGKGPLGRGPTLWPVHTAPPEAINRARLGPRIDLGVAALNVFTTCRSGQRLGLFAGAGVGKSTMMGMLARNTECDVTVVALVGERGREVREFLEDDLTAAGLARAIVVIATSDSPPLMRREAAPAAMAIAEHFRDSGRNVLFMMDSVTRYCMALREIGLSTGELPAARGYPPSVFAELPRLLERAGPGRDGPDGAGYITGLFSVLVEGDDHNEPIADAIRGILDGHVVLDRRIADRGRYPAIDVLRSLSRSVPGCNSAEENALTRRARELLAVHDDMQDLLRLGAYKVGTDPKVDEAVRLAPQIEMLLRQDRNAHVGIAEGFQRLRDLIGVQ